MKKEPLIKWTVTKSELIREGPDILLKEKLILIKQIEEGENRKIWGT